MTPMSSHDALRNIFSGRKREPAEKLLDFRDGPMSEMNNDVLEKKTIKLLF